MGPMTGRRTGSCGRGSRNSGQGNNPDWLASLVGTAVLALGSLIFRTLSRKLKSSPEKDAAAGTEKKPEN